MNKMICKQSVFVLASVFFLLMKEGSLFDFSFFGKSHFF